MLARLSQSVDGAVQPVQNVNHDPGSLRIRVLDAELGESDDSAKQQRDGGEAPRRDRPAVPQLVRYSRWQD